MSEQLMNDACVIEIAQLIHEGRIYPGPNGEFFVDDADGNQGVLVGEAHDLIQELIDAGHLKWERLQ